MSWSSTSTSSLHVDLTGWAKPIYRGELTAEFKTDMEAE